MTLNSMPDRAELLSYLNHESDNQIYTREFGISSAITSGDSEALSKITSEWYQVEYPFDKCKDGKFSDFEWHQMHLNILNISCRIAAATGGLVKQSTHLISSKYSLLIDRGKSIDYLNDVVFHVMLDEYCTAVNLYSTKNLSQTMFGIVSYINDHLTEELSLSEIASLFNLHPVHLARKFKQETGATFVDYTNTQRINFAKYLFYLDTYSLSEIAYISGFNSHSYFTKVCKKTCKETPSQFSKRIKEIY